MLRCSLFLAVLHLQLQLARLLLKKHAQLLTKLRLKKLHVKALAALLVAAVQLHVKAAAVLLHVKAAAVLLLAKVHAVQLAAAALHAAPLRKLRS